ncbi:MAG: ACP S-malonyltransferase [bacterium]
MKKALLFPGQGSQEVGMAHDLFEASPDFRALIELGSDLTHENLEALCLRGPEKRLRRSFFLQPVLVAVSLGYLKRFAEQEEEVDVVLGHSLGEITALAASGMVSDRQAVTIAAKRGELMDEAAARCNGGMLAVLSVPLETVQEVLAEIGEPDRLTVANDNAPDQVVLSGDSDLLRQFSDRLAARRLGRCRSLPVAGPWHSPLMEPARQAFEHWIAKIDFLAPKIPFILNATGAVENDPQKIRQLITGQLTAPVLWRDCMNLLKRMEVGLLLEVGPGRVLSGLARVNGLGGETRIFNLNNLRGLAHYREEARQPGEK